MTGDNGIETPYSLATLPRSPQKSGGVKAAGVTSLNGSKKRKRGEVAVSVDGEGVNIYKVSNPQLVAAYAVPPQSRFLIPPHSIVQKRTKSTPATRYTYTCVDDNYSWRGTQVLSYAEKIERGTVHDLDKRAFDLDLSASRLLSIETIANAGQDADEDSSHDVILLHENGHIQCRSAGLQKGRWTAKLSQGASGPAGAAVIQHSSCSPAEVAKRGLLKGRADVLAAYDSAQLSTITILSTVSHPQDPAAPNAVPTVNIYAIQSRPSELGSVRRGPIQHLLSWDLPQLEIKSALPQLSEFSLQQSTGALQQITNGSVLTYDLSGILPRYVSTLRLKDEAIEHQLRLSDSLTLVSGAKSCQVYDLTYNSLQASIDLKKDATLSNGTRKRSASHPDSNIEQFRPILFLSESRLVVGLDERNLVGMTLSAHVMPRKKSKAAASLLIHSLGKGTGNKASRVADGKAATLPKCLRQPIVAPVASDGAKWAETCAVLDRCVSEKDPQAFDGSFLKSLQQSKQPDGQNQARSSRTERVTPAGLTLRNEQEKALYALSKIFGRHQPLTNGHTSNLKNRSCPLEVDFLPTATFGLLVESGHLNLEFITRALRSSHGERLLHGDITSALISYDPDLRLLYAVLTQHPCLPIGEVVQAIKTLIQSLDNAPLPLDYSTRQPLLTNSETINGGDIDGEDEDDSVDDEVDAASLDLCRALSTLEDGLLIRSQSLRQALMKLHTFPSETIASSLRANLSHHEVIFLINILRLELVDGGWTSRYLHVSSGGEDITKADSAGSPSDRAITIISDLLSCCLDAVGVGGCLGPTTNSSDNLIHHLRSEITTALEGVHEAVYLQGLLKEFSVFASRKDVTVPLHDPNKQKGLGQPVTISNTTDLEESLLPLGLKVESRPSATRVADGGEVRMKSRRHIGMEISKKVPRYSFERLII